LILLLQILLLGPKSWHGEGQAPHELLCIGIFEENDYVLEKLARNISQERVSASLSATFSKKMGHVIN